MKKINAPSPVAAMLAKVIAPYEAEWRNSVVTRFVRSAEGQFEYFKTKLANDVKPDYSSTRYVKYLSDPAKSYELEPRSVSEMKAALAAGKYAPDIKKATLDGEREYQGIRESFLYRAMNKAEFMLGTKVTGIEGEVVFAGALEGTLKYLTDEGTTVSMKFNVKTNYRYDHNARNGHLTVYAQYPFVVTSAVVKGVPVKAKELSDEEMAKLILGKEYEKRIAKSDEEKAAKAALKAEKEKVKRTKEGYAELLSRYDHMEYYATEKPMDEAHAKHMEGLVAKYKAEIVAVIEKWATKYGIKLEDPGSKKAAFKVRGEWSTKLKAFGSVR